MEDKELTRVVNFIEGYYHRKLETNEIKAIKVELKDYTFQTFYEDISKQLLNKVEFFSVSKLHQIVQEERQLKSLLNQLGIKSLEEIYEN